MNIYQNGTIEPYLKSLSNQVINFSFLSTGYAEQLLTKCVDNWKSHKKNNHRSKLLVLAPSITTATQYLEWLQKLGIKALKATSDESKEAQAAIKRFKKHYNYGDAKAVDALVTVAMAYEGLDVPAITHVACLTNIRSKPWLEQSSGRTHLNFMLT